KARVSDRLGQRDGERFVGLGRRQRLLRQDGGRSQQAGNNECSCCQDCWLQGGWGRVGHTMCTPGWVGAKLLVRNWDRSAAVYEDRLSKDRHQETAGRGSF